MGSGDLTTGTISTVDIQDNVEIAAAIDAITGTTVNDKLFIIAMPGQNRVKIIPVAREA